MLTFKEAKTQILKDINAAVTIRSWADVNYYQGIIYNRNTVDNKTNIVDFDAVQSSLDSGEWVTITLEDYKTFKNNTLHKDSDFITNTINNTVSIKYK